MDIPSCINTYTATFDYLISHSTLVNFRLLEDAGMFSIFFFFKKVGGGLVAEGTQVCVSMVDDIHY